MILIFPTVVIGLEAVYGRSYGDLLMLSTAAFTAFGLFALPCGWLADNWSRRNMIAIFFIGTGICCVAGRPFDRFHDAGDCAVRGRLVCRDLSSGRHADGDRRRGQPRPHDGVQRRVRQYRRLGRERHHRRDHRLLGWRSAFFIPAAALHRDRVSFI